MADSLYFSEKVYSYQSTLRRILKERQQRNKRYSLRAYARDLGISASFLSDIMKSKENLSPDKAKL